MGYTRIQEEPFSLDTVLRALRADTTGGVTFYVGTVRAVDETHRVESLTYEAYPEMAEATLERLRRETLERFGLTDAIVIHRLGRLAPGDAILLVAFAGAHRAETFRAVAHFMDELKRVVPIWKREEGPQGPTWILGERGQRVKP